MKMKSIPTAGLALLFATLGAKASSVPFDAVSYIFPLTGGGGGATATLNSASVDIYCDDFDNVIYVPSNNSADVTQLSTTANLSLTRFGGVSSDDWTQITTLGTTDDAFFNSGAGSSALARYEMAAYLVSQYNPSLGNNTSNNQIQEAIWTLMDPTAEGAAINPANVDPSLDLENAMSWYTSMNATPSALNAFLSRFEIVSAANMTYSNGLGIGGFQEQIVMSATPEPRGTVIVLFALLIGGFVAVRRGRFARASGAPVMKVS